MSRWSTIANSSSLFSCSWPSRPRHSRCHHLEWQILDQCAWHFLITGRSSPELQQQSLPLVSNRSYVTSVYAAGQYFFWQYFFFCFAGKGILAVDESTKTIGKRLQSIGIENTEENRQTYRGRFIATWYVYIYRLMWLIKLLSFVYFTRLGLLFSAPGLGKYISGAILYEETLFQSHSNGTPFVDLLKANGLFPGIKVDTGLQPLPGADPIETWCGLQSIYAV